MPLDHTPTCFISYSWDSTEHRDWVRQLATALRGNGVDAILDVFHAPLGSDLAAFMSRIATSDFVLIVCTPGFRAKSLRAVGGTGGIGFEQAIITGHIFTGAAKPEKFIPILRSGNPTEALPDYLLNRHWADFRDDSRFAPNLEQLLRAIYAVPEHAVPPLGTRPAFMDGGVTGAEGAPAVLPSFHTRYFEAFDLDDDDPVASARYANVWTIGEHGSWRGSIRQGVYHLSNARDTDAVHYGYIGMGNAEGPLDDLSNVRAAVDVQIGGQNTGPFTSAGLLFRFDRARRHYTGLVMSRQVTGGQSRGQLHLVRRDQSGFGLTPLGAPARFDPAQRVNLAMTGRGEMLELWVDDALFRSVPAPPNLRGDPGVLAISTGEFDFDNFVIADVG